jgi:uncharacterized protein
MISSLLPITAGSHAQAALIELNNVFAKETSFLDAGAWQNLVGQAFYARFSAPAAAFLIAFDQTADYASPNFLWFRQRFKAFVYIDRIVVSQAAQGRGLARMLYEDLFACARAAGHERIVCEVNIDPPNPGSDAFHARLGFSEMGRAELIERQKTVRYLELKL